MTIVAPVPGPTLPARPRRADHHPVERSITGRWARVVAEGPDRTAFSSAGVRVDYAEADRRSELLARNVLHRSGSEGPLGLFVDLTVEGLTTLLGALRTGRPVVPLDPHLPASRLEVIVEIAGLRTLLVADHQQTLARTVAGLVPDVLPTGELLETVDPLTDLPRRGGADPAFIVFTSGSTGRPKGVVLTHDLVLDSADNSADAMGVGPDDRMLMALPLSFTAGALVFGAGILNGAGLFGFDPRGAGLQALPGVVRDERLTTFHATPHLLRSAVATLAAGESLGPDLRLVVTAGEALYGRDVELVRPHLPSTAAVVNWAGSSEGGSLGSHTLHSWDPVPAGALPAGTLVPSKQVRLLGQDDRDVPPGTPGEVVLTSAYLSGGYWNDPVRTAEKFRREADGRTTYRTGDLGRFDEHGLLHLLGRMDGGVKVRGYLVELSEVEGALLSDPAIAEACVVAATQDGSTRLTAYVAPSAGARADSPAAIRRRLRGLLPEYMVPATVVPLPSLPRTERGKIDRPQLPPAPARTVGSAPDGTTEEQIAQMWSGVLGLDEVGADEDFWELGGDSLSVEEVLTLTQARYGVHLVSGDLVDAPTVREFAARVGRVRTALTPHPTALTLRAGGTGTPLFCFAGAGALGAAFVALSRHTGDRPVHAFQAHGIERRGLPDWSVTASARRHLQVLRVIQPSGPYVLVGHSLGGLVALEVARSLRDAGEDVALVTLLDTYLPSSIARGSASSGAADPSSPALLREVPEEAGPGARQRLGRVLGTVQRYRARARNVPLKLLVPLTGVVPFHSPRQFGVFFEQGMLLSRRHRLRPYDGPTLVVRAGDNPDAPDAWVPHLTGDLHREDLGSDHNSLLREPYVAQVAALLTGRLRAAGL